QTDSAAPISTPHFEIVASQEERDRIEQQYQREEGCTLRERSPLLGRCPRRDDLEEYRPAIYRRGLDANRRVSSLRKCSCPGDASIRIHRRWTPRRHSRKRCDIETRFLEHAIPLGSGRLLRRNIALRRHGDESRQQTIGVGFH